MKNFKILSVIILTILISTACNNKSQNKFLPTVKGEANSVVVVMTGKYWESGPGDKIREKFQQFITGLPQEEPTFDILFIPHSDLDQIYQKQRNILITMIGPDYQDKIVVQKDRWAKGQIIITVMSPDSESFVKLIENKSDEIIKLINDYERTRLIANFKSGADKKIEESLLKRHKIKLNIPVGYKVERDVDNFVWLDNEYREIIEGILIYYYPYNDSSTFTKEFQVNKRNEVLKEYVQGEVEGSYMSTEMRFPIETYSFNDSRNRYTMELRGLWLMKNGTAMGGPFVSITKYDEKNKRIITVEGFVFAPSQEKRNLVRRVEAIIYSLDF